MPCKTPSGRSTVGRVIGGRLWVKLISRQAFADYMKFRGETCKSLADKVGCHKSLIGHLRSGHRSTCGPATATAIEKQLNAPPGSLFVARVSHVYQGERQSA